MKPTDFAAQVHAQFPPFRAQREAVRQHAQQLASGHELTLPPATEQPLPVIEAATPGGVNDRLLAALFGRWPPSST